MKILVITYSHEVNPGTFLQAYGVQTGLRKIFPDASIEFIKHKKVSANGSVAVRKTKKDFTFIKAKLRAIPRRLKYEFYYRKCFSFSDESFDFFNYDEKRFKSFTRKYDLIVVGSDTILIQLKGKSKQLGLMWLNGIDTQKIFFAASAAPATYQISSEEKTILARCLNSYKYLGVRDDITINLLKNRIGNLNNPVIKQLDPTYFLKDEIFKLSRYQLKRFNKYASKKVIVLVNFSQGFKFKAELTNNLKKFGFTVVSTHYNEDAHYNLMELNPFQWGALFKYISFTITDRFHDTVFSLRNNKMVFSIDWDLTRFSSENNNSKSSDLLSIYDITQNHFIIQTESDIEYLLKSIKTSWNNPEMIEKIKNRNVSQIEKNDSDLNLIKTCLI